jgi:phosphatidylglycerophosphate synthase
MFNRFHPSFARQFVPAWLAPLLLGAVLLIAPLAVFAERGTHPPAANRTLLWPAAAALVAAVVYVATWLLELGGLCWSRLVFVAAALIPAAALLRSLPGMRRVL